MNQVDIWINIGFTVVIQLLQTLNTDTQVKFRKVFLKVNRLTAAGYGNDPDFKKEWVNVVD